MPKFAANLSMLFTELPEIERFQAAAEAGFQAVEIQFPYSIPKETIAAELARHGLEMVLINLPAGDWSAGERGIAALPEREQEFRDGVTLALDYAETLGVTRINCLAGIPPADYSADEVEQTFIHNGRYAADLMKSRGITLTIEAINSKDIPGFWIDGSCKGLDLIAKIDRSNVKLQYDIYHMQRMEGDLLTTLARELDKIAHIQFADVPGRHEPGTGEINFDRLFNALDSFGYSGFVSAEYIPSKDTKTSLSWLNKS